MTFDVTADAYARFMGRFSSPLAEQFVDLLGPRPGQRALDVGCGPGALTVPLVGLLGVDAVAAVDPSEPFVASVRERLPGLDVREAAAEHLPFEDDAFDLALAQLVVHFMADPVAGLREMARVTRPGGTVAASVWDHSSGGGPLSAFWEAVKDLDPGALDESRLPGTREGHLAALFAEAGLPDARPGVLSVRVGFTDFEDWWAPYTLGVGPAGAYVARLGPDRREELRARCAQRLPDGPFEIEASAWCVRAHA
ncbi:class I SAM-dependent methyltransferase [Nocardioides panacis]|uniref:Class I SAM-dependent methyltransferase n=1 Tax=Nocardioides panacis TaxID=2849501 RepID=A0A975SYV1_9ACTN|nr:class I SAM-dependent methyltransferase [Nocardioides panacis]QWZ08371.1 class I SAM-dependent methyltransferase [Nocardioides panacis]